MLSVAKFEWVLWERRCPVARKFFLLLPSFFRVSFCLATALTKCSLTTNFAIIILLQVQRSDLNVRRRLRCCSKRETNYDRFSWRQSHFCLLNKTWRIHHQKGTHDVTTLVKYDSVLKRRESLPFVTFLNARFLEFCQAIHEKGETGIRHWDAMMLRESLDYKLQITAKFIWTLVWVIRHSAKWLNGNERHFSKERQEDERYRKTSVV